MARRSKPNRKRKEHNNLAARARTAAVALALGALSSFGLWRCLGEEPEDPDAPLPRDLVTPAIDVGEDAQPDPTLVNEAALLKAEEPEEPQPPAVVDDADKAEIDEPEQPSPDPDEAAVAELEERFPLHAVAYHFHTQIMAEAGPEARVIGYARRGAIFRVSERVGTDGCPRGWHELPGGGYLCDGAGAKVAREPVTFAPAPPDPRLDAPLPYDYHYAREDDTPEFWRLPTAEELAETKAVFGRLRARDEGRLAPRTPVANRLAGALARAAAIADDRDAGSADGGVDDPPPPAPEPDPEPAAAPPPTSDAGAAPDPFALPPYVHLRMAKGYFVSTDDKVHDEGGDYLRTVRGRFVPEARLFPAQPSSFEGVLLGRQATLPLVFVVGGGVKLLKQEDADGPLKTDRLVTRYDHLPFLGTLKRKGRRYVQVGEGLFLPARTAAIAEAATPPEDLLPGERWIDVNLRQQTLVAYEGETPVFATLISSGREGFETPEGSFRIYGKHVTITMDDPNAGAEAYSIEDVPWTQYFEEGYALHAAFWHDRFGRVRSHGCVNLSPADARRLFFWTGPHVPQGLHGIVATRENPGTRVVIHK